MIGRAFVTFFGNSGQNIHMKKHFVACIALLVLGLVSIAPAQQKVAATGSNAVVEPSLPYSPSLDVGSMDKTVDPCVDFYQYSCGGWMKNNPIPADQPAWGRFNELAERNRESLRQILETAAKPGPRTPNEQKIGDYYASCMDEDAINKKGIAPIQPALDHINSLKDKGELTEMVAHLHSRGIDVLFSFGSRADFKNAKQVIGIGVKPPPSTFTFHQRGFRLLLQLPRLSQVVGISPRTGFRNSSDP